MSRPLRSFDCGSGGAGAISAACGGPLDAQPWHVLPTQPPTEPPLTRLSTRPAARSPTHSPTHPTTHLPRQTLTGGRRELCDATVTGALTRPCTRCSRRRCHCHWRTAVVRVEAVPTLFGTRVQLGVPSRTTYPGFFPVLVSSLPNPAGCRAFVKVFDAGWNCSLRSR